MSLALSGTNAMRTNLSCETVLAQSGHQWRSTLCGLSTFSSAFVQQLQSQDLNDVASKALSNTVAFSPTLWLVGSADANPPVQSPSPTNARGA